MKLARWNAGRLDEAEQAFEVDGAVLITGVQVRQDDDLICICSRFGSVIKEGNGPPPGALIRELEWHPGDGRSAPLPMHTDSAFARYPHAAMALACLTAAAGGSGESMLVGVDDAATRLDQADLDTLSSATVTFTKRRDGAVQQAWTAPVLARRADRLTIRFHREHIGASGENSAVSRAIERLAHVLDDPGAQVQVQLAPGDVLVLDNLRVLHGRTALTGNTARHLRRLKMRAHSEQT